MSDDFVLNDDDFALLSARADAFYSALQVGHVADWSPYLQNLPSHHVRSALLVEMIVIEMNVQAQKGQVSRVEEYLQRYPELQPAERVPVKMIQEEYRARSKAGEVLTLAEYQSRFPVQFAARPTLMDSVLSELAKDKAPPPALAKPESFLPQPQNEGERQSRTSDYIFVKKLGSGVFGEVWLGRSAATGIEKAIKILHKPADEEAAVRELRSLELIKNLRHPYLLTTEDFWVAENRLYIVMELADDTLRGRMKECLAEGHDGIPLLELFGVMVEAADGLDYLHERKVLHRDVKPDNILLQRGHAKVADFGLARQQEQMLAQMSVFAGSPAYMAPEVWAGEAGPASDLYSFVVTYIELRQGRLPFALGPVTEVMLAHLDSKFEFAEHLGADEVAVLRKALAKAPAERFTNCLDFMEALAIATDQTFSRPRVGSRSRSGMKPVPPPRKPSAQPNDTPRQTIKLSQIEETAHALKNRQTASTRGLVGRTTGPAQTRTTRPGGKGKLPVVLAVGVVLAVLSAIIGLVLVVLFWPPTQPTTSTTSDAPDSSKPTVTTPPTERPLEPKPLATLPANFTAVGDTQVSLATGGRVPEEIAIIVNGQKLQFRLIQAGAPDSTKPFYISVCKITRGMLAGSAEQADLTATGMTVTEAMALCTKIHPAGRLPTPNEWDHASGMHRPNAPENITLPGGQAWVNTDEATTARSTEAAKDINNQGLFDMAGNGTEWTCGVLTAPGKPPKIEERTTGVFQPGELLVVRGKRFTARRGLTMAELQREREELPQTQFADKASPYTGFRVVLPVPLQTQD